MHQGQICKIYQRDHGNIGWYQKLRDDNGAVKYFRVERDNTLAPASINDSQVETADARSLHAKPYVITYVMPVEEQISSMAFNPANDAAQNIVNRQGVVEIQAEITRLERAAENEARLLHSLENALNISRRKRESLLDSIEDLRQARASIEGGGEPSFMYAYGRHNPGGADYCWRVPSSLESRVLPGRKMLVETRDGETAEATVTRTECLPVLLRHKSVISIDPYV